MQHIDSEFPEAQYQCFIDRVLRNEFRSGGQFSVNFYSGAEERRRGYDIEVMSHTVLFLQLKRSTYYPPKSTPDYLAERSQLGCMDTTGAYSFSLHVDAKKKRYLQHNLLVRLNRRFKYARYIAPLFYQKQYLENLMYDDRQSVQWAMWPILERGADCIQWDIIRFPHSISIKPTQRAMKAPGTVHSYFFNADEEVTFHSTPERVDKENVSTIPELVRQMIMNHRKTGGTPFGEVYGSLYDVLIASSENEHKSTDSVGDCDRAIMESVYLELFGKEVSLPPSKLLRILHSENKLVGFRLLTAYLHKYHGIQTYLVSWS